MAKKKHKRHKDDDYRTADHVVDALLHAIGAELYGPILEPSCGEGAILRGLVRNGCQLEMHGVEKSRKRARVAREDGQREWFGPSHRNPRWTVSNRNFLKDSPDDRPRHWMTIIGNPPYVEAEAFVRKGLRLLHPNPSARLVFLLRLGFLASKERIPLYELGALEHVIVLPKRPCFTGNGRTDATEYAWFIWNFHHEADPAIHWMTRAWIATKPRL